MTEIATVGLDLDKNLFQVHAVDAVGAIVVRRQLRRAQLLLFFSRLAPCLIGMEACAGAHCWARVLAAFGHEVRLIPPSCVKPFARRGKTDAADAEAICTAVVQPTMRFLPVKTEAQQAVLRQHRTRDFLVRQLTQPANAIRAHLGEFGVVVPKGVHTMGRLVATAKAVDLPTEARMPLDLLVGQFNEAKTRIDIISADLRPQAHRSRRWLAGWHDQDEAAQGRGDRAGQPHGAGRLGHAANRRGLAGGVKTTRSGRRPVRTEWRGQSEMMQTDGTEARTPRSNRSASSACH